MINLTFNVSNLTEVTMIYDRIEVMRWKGESGVPSAPVTDTNEYELIASGTDIVSNRLGVSDVLLDERFTQYYLTDPSGEAYDWYISRYSDDDTGSVSGWSDPIIGEPHDIYYNPFYPPEIVYGSTDQLIIDRIRLLIGDPLDLRREYGEDAASSIHPDGRTYEMDERGWPATINMGGVPYNSITDPTVNGYRFLRFGEDITTTNWITTSGGECVEQGVDIWYYTFRHSDREIMRAYDNCPPPPPLTMITATSEAYMLKTAYELLYSEFWMDTGEDGAVITDSDTRYDPSPGLDNRRQLLEALKKRLDDLIKALTMVGVTGVLID